jgi:hypothetical protein
MSESNRSKSIDFGDLTEVVLGAVSRALDERPAAAQSLFLNPSRIVCGFILDPLIVNGQLGGGTLTSGGESGKSGITADDEQHVVVSSHEGTWGTR